MSTRIEKIIEQALQLSPKDRAVIAEHLISSLETITDSGVEAAWQQEIQRRVMEIEKGEVACIPWEEVRERLRNKAGATD